MFGGSSVAGHGNSVKKTISAFLEEVLREREFFAGKNVRVINAGIGSAFSAQQLALLTTKVSLYEPDWVIFFDGNNDQGRWHYDNFYPFAPADLRPNYHSYDYTLTIGLHRVQDPIGAAFHSVNLWNQHFPLLHYSAVLAKHLRTTRSTPSLPINPAPAATTRLAQDDFKLRLYRRKTNSVYNYILNLKMALGAANAIGAKGIACLQPGLPYLRPDGSPRKSRLVGPEQEADCCLPQRPGTTRPPRSSRRSRRKIRRRVDFAT